MSDPPKRLGIDTVPPPPGEEDLYSASTVVGQASEEILALVRSAEQSNAERTAAKRASAQVAANEDDKLKAMKEVAARAAKQAVANEVAREATKAAQSGAPPPPSGPPAARVVSVAPSSAPVAKAPPPSAAPASPAPEPTAPTAPTAPPPVVAKVASTPTPAAMAAPRRTQGDTTKRPAVRTAADETRPATGLPPIVTILVVFAVAALTLAALVR
jgi:cobalamin biosynthesis Mg chelatase CobN